ncbi:hypothetical protein GCM10010517_21120 [Streptosporangium fragile]|uniref:Uncharacterized protein n=1 Tax=Streptosporangium fragile TaxID=46186 RepID=A0ABP6IAF2_9ACTN
MRVLLASLAAGAVSLPVPAGAPAAAVEDLVIRSVTLRPAAPVVGPTDAVRLVIEVVARGVAGPAGVTIQVEPGAPPGSGATVFPVGVPDPAAPDPRPRPGPRPEPRPGPDASPASRPAPRPGPAVPPDAAGPGSAVPARPGPDAAVPVRPGPAVPVPVRPGPGAVPRPGPFLARGPAPLAGLAAPRHAVPGHAATGAGAVVSRAADGWETWRFAPEDSLDRWYPAGRWTVTVTARGTGGRTVTGHAGFWLKRETKFSAVQATGRGEGTRVRGALNRVDPQGYLDYAPFPDRPVEILHRASEREEWTEMGTTTTDAHGRFGRTLPVRPRGEWRIRFDGSHRYAPSLSAVHRIPSS